MRRVRALFSGDGDGEGELIVEVFAPPFAGASSAWFHVAQLVEFATRLGDAYPLSAGKPLRLLGGVWGEGTSGLEQVHVGLTFYPLGGRGVVACKVDLLLPSRSEAHREACLEIELLTSYEAVRDFARGLSSIARGESQEAVLECAEV